MTQDQDAKAGQDKKQAAKIKRAGYSCITLFVVFVIVLLSFGKTPLTRTTSEEATRVDFDLISCLGIGVGIYAVFFLLLSCRTVLRLPGAKKVLGLIGGFGLIAHSLVAVLTPLLYGAGGAAVGTAGNTPFAREGPEQWRIDGQVYRVESTYYLRLPDGLQYTIEYPWRFRPSEEAMNDDRALETAFPLMKHAYENGLYKRVSTIKIGQGELKPSRIGVTLFQRRGKKVRGYRVALTLAQIKKRIKPGSASTSRAPRTKESGRSSARPAGTQ